MTIPATSFPTRRNAPRRFAALVAFAVLLAGVALLASRSERSLSAAPPPSGKPVPTTVGGQPLWVAWPKNQKPDAVLVFSGQTFGYLQPCGCSRPQTGGLERRAVLIEQLKAKGWPVAGIDLGDLYAEKAALAEQGKLKYVATMNALREMGYLAVGVGRTELSADFLNLVAAYALQKEQRPFTLAGNVVGKPGQIPRAQIFPPPPKATRPLVEMVETAKVGEVPVGVAGIVGKRLNEENEKEKWNPILDFPDAQNAIKGAVKELANHPLKPQVKVLIFQGPLGDAAKAAKDFPEFQVILCQSESDLPPQRPDTVKHKDGSQTLIVTVGHRGQHVGVLGAFAKSGGGFDFHYQLVPLTEEFIAPDKPTAPAVLKTLQSLEDYAEAVKKAKLLPDYPRTPHPAKIQAASLKPPANLTFVGSDACKACHSAEYDVWAKAPHSHAMNTLEKYAKRPSLRNFDGECVVCHTVGFKHEDGYIDDAKTPHLRDVGCESCHGPGSGHVAQPKHKDLLALLSPWKQPGADHLPDAAFMKKMLDTPIQDRGQIAIPLAQRMLIIGVERKCIECHDHDADPKFDIYERWPKIDHSGLAPKGGWPAVAPKK